MPLVGTTIPEAIAALRTALAARSGLDGVQVSWGHPGRNIRQEVIVVGFADGDQEPAAIGQRRREEEYRLRVRVNVQKRASAEEVTTRCVAIAREVETEVRDTPDLGQGAVLQAQVARFELQTWKRDQGHEAEVRLDVAVKARI